MVDLNQLLVKRMDIPLVIDKEDQKWALVGKILDIIPARRVKQDLAKQGLEPVDKAGALLRIALIVIFFSVELYRFLSRFDEAQFIGCVSGVLNAICTKSGREGAMVIASTDLRCMRTGSPAPLFIS
jgi:hypothetical protein